MELEEPIYDLRLLARRNWHIHTNFSTCAAYEMSVANVLAHAEYADLDLVALVDHHHARSHNILRDIRRIRKEIKAFNPVIEVLVGAELSAFGVGKYSDSERTNRKIEYRLYAGNHYHIEGWDHPETLSPRAYAEHILAVLTDVLRSGRADCIAHPFIGKYLKARLDDPTAVTNALFDKELGDILELGTTCGVAWEINTRTLRDDPDFVRRYWNLGREVGVTFRLGTDAHRLPEIDPHQYVDELQALAQPAP